MNLLPPNRVFFCTTKGPCRLTLPDRYNQCFFIAEFECGEESYTYVRSLRDSGIACFDIASALSAIQGRSVSVPEILNWIRAGVEFLADTEGRKVTCRTKGSRMKGLDFTVYNFTSGWGEPVPVKSAVCPCGIHRADCTYHRE